MFIEIKTVLDGFITTYGVNTKYLIRYDYFNNQDLSFTLNLYFEGQYNFHTLCNLSSFELDKFLTQIRKEI